ncbi:MAG TPA: phosphoribosylformylglycinamidine cyclo-ligase [Phycisphaerales bacterium]|nr:phosphoribosylformylglycinamidine cyclo-ligase [Phycisphaerales bacterium]
MPTSTKKSLTYADTGVDIEAGDRLVGLIQTMMRRTHGPRVLGEHGGFAGMFRLDFNERLFKQNFRDPVLVACTDGVGTKVKLACEMKIYDTVGIDCVAMNVNDMIVQGAEPLIFLDYLGLHTQDPEVTAQIVAGVARGCEISNCALIGGECAEMPDIYQEGDFDIAGFAVGVVELDRAIDPSRVEAGDILIGLPSSGVHSNGFTLARAAVANLDLNTTYEDLDKEKTLGEILLEPTRIYVRQIVKLLRQYKVKKVVSGMSHITGGGLGGNICRSLNDSVDATVHLEEWEIPAIFDFLQKHGNIDTEEMYRVFNMGIGYVLAVRPACADSIIAHLKQSGEDAIVIGKVTKGSGKVHLKGLKTS